MNMGNSFLILINKHLRRYLPIIIGLFVALVFSFASNLYLGWGKEILTDHLRLIMGLVEQWLIVIFLLALILFLEHQTLSSIGIKKMSKRDVFWGVLGFLVGSACFLITTPIISALNLTASNSGAAQIISTVPFSLRVAMVLTAGITEEIIFRGYMIERLNTLTGHIGVSAIISYIVFVMFHIPFWGLGGAIQIGTWSIVITVLYMRRKNLTACILMHILTDMNILIPVLFIR